MSEVKRRDMRLGEAVLRGEKVFQDKKQGT